MKTIFVLLILTISFSCFATTYKVGSTRAFQSPNALYLANVLQDGDTIEIDAETFTGSSALAVWQENNLLIKGMGGFAQLDADGQYILGKGIWVLAGNNITVENIEFYGATVPDNNGAGIRLDGVGMIVRRCFFHDNENGILTSNPYAGEILIEYSEFANNGYGDGFTHNLYIGHVDKLTFRFNYSHHTKIGHNLKSRANENYILYNRIMDEEFGTSSRLIDLSNGGFSIVMGNLFMQGNNAPNNNLIGYGLEGLSNTSSSEFYFINNTLVNKRIASCLFLDIHEETSIAKISNNIFTGSGDVYNGTIAELNNNIIEPSIANLNFVDESNYNYHLNSNSPAIDFGIDIPPVNGHALTPDLIYNHPTNFETRTINNNVIDVGAYEYEGITSVFNVPNVNFLVYPNPVSDVLNIEIEVSEINNILIFDSFGGIVLMDSNSISLNLSSLPCGLYFLKIELKSGKIIAGKIIKN
jgi:hypothetical protein